ncbi:MAG: AbrB/MazE/SpoVT family DNA-binding domain-containing protein [Candidatus Hydrogenedentota bacterium]|nr:MAG: AbrB/MazE/SpoVT family DNA-binding domain-containing protein [Candidatus Hydrogenedentota bacterium]
MKVNAKGQVVIPAEIRREHGIVPGDEVEFRSEKGKLVLVKAGGRRVQKWAGKFKFKFPRGVKTTDEFIEAIRGR